MNRPKSSAEAENRAAFLVQLKALFTQIGLVVNNLTAANKTRVNDIIAGLEVWNKEIGHVGLPLPSIVAPATPAASAHSSPRSTALRQQGSLESNAPSPRPVDETTADAAAEAAPTAKEGDVPSSSFTAVPQSVSESSIEITSASVFGNKTIMDLVEFLRILFVPGLPESVKLRAMGKGLVRLVTVRCASTVTAALQHVARLTYSSGALDKRKDSSKLRYTDAFVLLARDLRRTAKALASIVEIMAYNTELTDAGAVRFTLQVCVDALRQTRRSMLFLQTKMEKEERLLLAKGGERASDGKSDPEDARSATNYAAERCKELAQLWGPSLVRSLCCVGDVIQPAVDFIVSVASIHEAGAAPELVNLKAEAKNDLFAFSDFTTTSKTFSPNTDHPSGELRPQEVETSFSMSATQFSLEHHALAVRVVQSMKFSYVTDYVAAVAIRCGDENDGQLVATSVVSECLRRMSLEESALLRQLTSEARWNQKLLTGILNCLLSPHPVVLGAGLQNLHVITTTCTDMLGEEVGYLYSNCIFRLLESENCPVYVKKEIVIHLLRTFLKPPAAAAAASEESAAPPLLLQLYNQYDLNIHYHQLNLTQHFIAALAGIVRRAQPTDFAQFAETSRRLAEQLSTGTDGKQLDELMSLPHSLPYVALHGLVSAIDLVRTQAPPEDDTGTDLLSKLENITCRDKKLEEQRMVDIFNASPKKGIKKLFNITDAEMDPEDTDPQFRVEYDHKYLPEVKEEATREKIQKIVSFLSNISSLLPESVAEFLTMPSVFPLQVCTVFMDAMSLAGRSLVEALKELLSCLQLPKEGQRIERLLEYFSAAYYRANNISGVDQTAFPFKDEDTCFVVVVATVMLNTDLYNPQVASRMTQSIFRSQLKACSNVITDSYADDIFLSISRSSLGTANNSRTLDINPADAYRGIDALFISFDERKQIAFGMERQRLACEARRLISRRSCAGAVSDEKSHGWTWWSAVARDFFLCCWGPLCTVFGPSISESATSPPEVLQCCIKGLEAVLSVAASFALPTECEVAMLALLRMVMYESVKDSCQQSVLTVAASNYSAHFSSRCWLTVMDLMITLKRERSASLDRMVEAVLSRIEAYTRVRCEMEAAGKEAPTAVREVVNNVLHSTVELLRNCASGDSVRLVTGLQLLQRVLTYSLIRHSNVAVVANQVNTFDVSTVVLPGLVELVGVHRNSDESLQAILGCVVELLGVMWTSCGTRGEVAQQPVEKDLSASAFVDCCEFFKLCYNENAKRATPSTLVKMHLLQGVQELVSRTLLPTEAGATVAPAENQQLPTYTMLSAWRRILFPLAQTLSDTRGSTTESNSLAVMVLRKLVVFTSSSNASVAHQMPSRVRSAILLLLSNVCYIGAMCCDVDNAQTCLGQLPTICNAALGLEETADASAQELTIFQKNQPDKLIHYLIHCSEKGNCFVVNHVLERICLLLRNEHEQVRNEAIASLHSLALQLQPLHVRFLTKMMIDVVLEGTVGWVSSHNEVPLSDPSLISFWLFLMDVPPNMKRCSRSSFRSILPSALGFMADELMVAVPTMDAAQTAQLLMERCLVPLIVSPSSNVAPVRSLAARALSSCAMSCLARYTPEANIYPIETLRNSVALVLFRLHVGLQRTVPDDAIYIGDRWNASRDTDLAAMGIYGEAAFTSLTKLINADPPDISGYERSATVFFSKESKATGAGAGAGAASASAAAAAAAGQEEGEDGAKRSQAAKKEYPFPQMNGPADIATDEQLVEYCSIIAPLLSGLPKVLCTVRTEAEQAMEVLDLHTWCPPYASTTVLMRLLTDAARLLFATLWRITHPYEMEVYLSDHLGGDVSTNTALLPHCAIRGALNSYLELVLQSPEYPLRHTLVVAVGLLRGIGQVQEESQLANRGDAAITIQRILSPQEQQHIRTCQGSMYQELSAVLSYWVKLMLHCSERSSLSKKRISEVEHMAADADLFVAFVGLLTPTAGQIINTAREYFEWYIRKKKMKDSSRRGQHATTWTALTSPPPETAAAKGVQLLLAEKKVSEETPSSNDIEDAPYHTGSFDPTDISTKREDFSYP